MYTHNTVKNYDSNNDKNWQFFTSAWPYVMRSYHSGVDPLHWGWMTDFGEELMRYK